MAYNKENIFNELVSNIEADQDITSFQDAALTVAPKRQTLYDWEFDKSDTLKSLIDRNKIKVKQSLRKQWKDKSASPTLQLALYKLLATDTERKALSMEYTEHSGEVKQLIMPKFVMDEQTDSEKPD